MTYDTSRQADVRVPVTVVELYLDTCAESFGVSPCTASGAAGTECYNTFLTCQDTANFNNTQKTYRFYQPVSNWPIGQIGFPCVKGQPKFTPCEIDPKGTLGKRGVVSIDLHDFADDDLYTDPYATTRTYTPELQGTFFGKLKARSPYYKGRLMKVRQGYINDPFSWDDFDDRLYVIDSLDLDQSGKVRITGKDLLKLADDKKSVAPEASSGTLSAAYTAGVSTTLVLQTGEGVDYDTDPFTGQAISATVVGYVRIGDNILKYTGVSTDTLTGVVGAQFGTTDEDASADDTVQQCLHLDNKNVLDIIYYLLNTSSGVASTYLPYLTTLDTELVTNGDFPANITGWTDASTGTGSIAWNASGYLDLTSVDASNVGIAKQSVTVVSGEVYTFSIDHLDVDDIEVHLGSTDNGTEYWKMQTDSTIGTRTVSFEATGTTLYVKILGEAGAATSSVDNVSVKKNLHTDQWGLEYADWLSSNDLTHIIDKPTGATKLIERICKQNLIYMWFDERDQQIKLKAIAPQVKNETPPTLTDEGEIIQDSIKVKDAPQNRISQIWVYYDIINVAEDLDKAENYKRLYVQVDTDSENVNAYSEKAIKVIYADWLSAANSGLITTLAGRLLSRYAGTPQTATFNIDHKDAGIWTGNVAILNSWAFQDSAGAIAEQKIQVLKVSDDHDKQQLTITAEVWGYEVVKYGFIGPNTLLSYTSESDANKAAYGFISDNLGKMSNGDNGYLITQRF